MSEFTEFAEFTKFTAPQDLDTVNDSTTRGVSEVTGLDFDLIGGVELIEWGAGQLNRDLPSSNWASTQLIRGKKDVFDTAAAAAQTDSIEMSMIC